MNDNIEIERIWEDNEFFQVKIRCCAETIQAETKVYITDETIDNFTDIIESFLLGKTNNCLWEFGMKGEGYTPYASLYFSRKDKLGHVQIEVFMELEDDGPISSHTRDELSRTF